MIKRKALRFSVVIPCYNEANYIANTLNSLKKQNYQGTYEVIVVDNNCNDKTAVIAKSLGAKVVREIHPGVCWARQAGTLAAKGEIVVSTDADTVFSKHWLTQIDKVFNSSSGVIAVAGPCHYVGGPLWGRAYAKILFGLIYRTYQLTGRAFYAPAVNFAFQKKSWDGYNTMLTQGGDEQYLLKQLKRKGKVVFDNKIVVFTSSRRLKRGFLYNLFVSLLLYSILEYNLSRLFKRRFFGSAPAFRNETSSKKASS